MFSLNNFYGLTYRRAILFHNVIIFFSKSTQSTIFPLNGYRENKSYRPLKCKQNVFLMNAPSYIILNHSCFDLEIIDLDN